MNKTQEDWESISDYLGSTIQRLRTAFGYCQHQYKQIGNVKIDELRLVGEELPKELVQYLSNPTHIVVFECKSCKKIKEMHYIKVDVV